MNNAEKIAAIVVKYKMTADDVNTLCDVVTSYLPDMDDVLTKMQDAESALTMGVDTFVGKMEEDIAEGYELREIADEILKTTTAVAEAYYFAIEDNEHQVLKNRVFEAWLEATM